MSTHFSALKAVAMLWMLANLCLALESRDEHVFVFSHHVTGWMMAKALTVTMHNYGVDTKFFGMWFGQPLAPDFEKMAEYKAFRCIGCFNGKLAPDQRVINVIRDPFDMIVSGYIYHRGGAEESGLRFVDFGERGGDLRPFFWPPIYSGLPTVVSNARRWQRDTYPAYLQRLSPSQGILAEMIRVLQWELPEVLSSVRTTRKLPAFHSVCMEWFAYDLASVTATLVSICRLDPSVAPGLASKLAVHAHHPELSLSDEELAFRAYLRNVSHQHDQNYFNGQFKRASLDLACDRNMSTTPPGRA